MHMCMTIKTFLCSSCLVGLRLLTLSLKEHESITKLHEQSVIKYCLNNTDIKKSLFMFREGEKKQHLKTSQV